MKPPLDVQAAKAKKRGPMGRALHDQQHKPARHSASGKVKGHTSEEDVHKGVVRAENKEGNDAADALAIAGAFENDRKTVSKNLRV